MRAAKAKRLLRITDSFSSSAPAAVVSASTASDDTFRRVARLFLAASKLTRSSSIMRTTSVVSGEIATLAGTSGLISAADTWSAAARNTRRWVTAWPPLVEVVDTSATSAPGVRVASRKLPSALVRVLASPASQTPLSLASMQTLTDWNTEATVLEAALAPGELAMTGGVNQVPDTTPRTVTGAVAAWAGADSASTAPATALEIKVVFSMCILSSVKWRHQAWRRRAATPTRPRPAISIAVLTGSGTGAATSDQLALRVG